MSHESDHTQAKERLLDTAENLFARKGFVATTLRDISTELGLTHASLYYHFPGGKEDLFAAVMERNILRHGAGLAAAITEAGSDLRARSRGAAAWLLSQPPIDLIRMTEADMPALPESVARKLMDLVYRELIIRLRSVFEAAVRSGAISASTDSGLVAGAFIGLVESLHSVPFFAVKNTRGDMANELIDILLKGLDYAGGGTK
ncbi:MAG: TetR/AcrR family transcriptional regulator [Treponemataceae bacterium]